MAHTETMLESKEIFNGRVIRVTVDKVQLEDGSTFAQTGRLDFLDLAPQTESNAH